MTIGSGAGSTAIFLICAAASSAAEPSAAAVAATRGTAAADGVAATAALAGEVRFLDNDGRVLRTLSDGETGDGFGIAFGTDTVPGNASGLLIGAPGADGGAGRVWIYDRATLGLLTSLGRESLDDDVANFGHRIVNMGHFQEAPAVHWAVAAPASDGARAATPSVVVLSEQGGALRERFRVTGTAGGLFGWTLFPVDDESTGQQSYNTHFAVGAPLEQRGKKKVEAGAVRRYAVDDGARSWTARGRGKFAHFGYAVSGADVNGDDVTDLIVGAPGRTDLTPAGKVFLLDGDRGRVVGQIDAPEDAVLFGYSVGQTDTDGDGVRDVIVGAPATVVNGRRGAGSVFVFSGVDDSLLRRIDGTARGQWLGTSFATVDDIDGDGVRELAIGSLQPEVRQSNKRNRGTVWIIASTTGKRLGVFDGGGADERFGYPIFATLLDVDGNGVFDVVASVTGIPPLYIPD